MDGSRRKKHAIARPWFKTAQALGSCSGLQGRAQLTLADTRQKTRVDPASRRGIEDEPRLRLTPLTWPEPLNRFFVGMHLHRQPIIGIEKLHQDRKACVLGYRSQ